MNVQEVMTREIVTCGPNDTLEAIASKMWNTNCGSIPIVESNGTLMGILTDRDIAMSAALNHKPLWELSADSVLNGRTVHTCHADEDIKSALKTMWAQHIRRVPVVDNEGQLQGMLSVDDIVTRAERGSRGQTPPNLSYDDAMATLKSVSHYH